MDAHDKPLIMILVKRAAIFMFTICSVSVIYWIIGSGASFLDETQTMLLKAMRLSSLGIVAFSAMGVLISACYAVMRRYRLRMLGILGYLAVSALGAAALYIAQSVLALSQGLR